MADVERDGGARRHLADVERDGGARRHLADVDRGQLILVTALAIAVTLVALVLLLNTVIYAENLATRGADVGGQDAVEFRGAAVRGVGGVLDAENGLDYDDPGHVRSNVTAGVERIDELASRQYLRRTELADLSIVTVTDGAIVRHTDDAGSFTNASGATEWTLAGEVSATRGFVLVVNDSALAGSVDDAFNVSLHDGTSRWSAYVYDDGGTVTVEVYNESAGSAAVVCTTTAPPPRLDLTAGTLDGEPCPGLRFGEGVSDPYEIRVENGDDAAGTYELVVLADPDTDSAIQANLADPGSGTDPYYAYAVYDVIVDVRFQTDALAFEDSVRVAPGEQP